MLAQPTMMSLRAAEDMALDTRPMAAFWRDATFVIARTDAMGNPVGRRATEIRSRWTKNNLYFLFICPYDELHLKPNPVVAAETNQLWNWDVAEVFLGSNFHDIRRYKEFEVSPQGEWIDLDIDLHKPHHENGWTWNSGFRVAAHIDPVAKIWYGAMRIPFAAIAPAPPAPDMEFRINLFRTEGPPSHLRSIAWQPPLTPTFHTPERFGLLRLVDRIEQSGLSDARTRYLEPLLGSHNYVPAKNSYLIQNLRKGEQKTVLDVAGSGSVWHIWSTWSVASAASTSAHPPPGRIRLKFFVDGATTPIIEGSLEELCRAAEDTGTRHVPLPAFVYKGAYNFYLPVWFAYGLRIEAEAIEDVEEFYTQIDYRLSAADTAQPPLVSERIDGDLVLQYRGEFASPSPVIQRDAQFAISDSTEVLLAGPGILRELSFRGDLPSSTWLQIYWDGEPNASVDAPLVYLFADFVNAAVESSAGKKTIYFPMPFQRSARIVLHIKEGASAFEGIECAWEAQPIPDSVGYFHAVYQSSPKTTGYGHFPILRVRGRGLFVGVNLFDTGHNHGGGDSALIDAASPEPRVLHGICGEDYFSFAWHETGAMTPLTGAPMQACRYRLHLENPYPFRECFQFLFGVFAGVEPKAVAFWYQQREPDRYAEWIGPDIPWKALGPLGPDPIPVGDAYESVVPFDRPVTLRVTWQDVAMIHGFADLTYLFRHAVFTSSGTGFIAGASTTRLNTHVFSPSHRSIGALFGHDDALAVMVNGALIASFTAHQGFAASQIDLPLESGWNALDLLISNDENINWRWVGVSFALEKAGADRLRFAAESAGADSKTTQS
ncbi:MAG: DUF2961 domain-containing protein [Acidobacteriaceae bacterium]|nr:DUF2961 domain-containing protein [Acidobacteriaceae bacterium]